MSAADLKLKISPSLLQAMGISANGEGIDYFKLFGFERTAPSKAQLDAAVMERSKQLRQWQSSPQYGEEVVALLKALHRAAKILQDDKRRAAYQEELERIESGKTISAADEFRDLVRAALVDGEISVDARNALNEYIAVRRLDGKTAQTITQEVREELKAKRAEAAAAAKSADNWEFRINESGEEGFGLMLMGLAASGKLRDLTGGQLLSEAQKYSVTPERAAKLIAEYKRHEFEAMIRVVAGSRALTTAQAKLLVDKAPTYGLDAQTAGHIIAEYTLSAGDPVLALGKLTLADTFGDAEISQIVEGGAVRAARRKRGMFASLAGVPDAALSAVKLVVGLAVIVGGGWWVKTSFFPNGFATSNNSSHGAAPTPTPAPTPHPGGMGTPVPFATPAETAAATPTATDTPPPSEGGALASLPDPPSGFMALPNEQPADPPAFELGIAEVTNAEFARFLQAMLAQAPPDWPNGQIPDGMAGFPVVNVTHAEVQSYVIWLNNTAGEGKYTFSLPTLAEYKRALRGRTMRAIAPTDPTYFQRAQLGGKDGLVEGKHTNWDKVYITGKGQIYDLVGNAAEWGQEAQGRDFAVLGGDFSLNTPDFNHLNPRWMPAATRRPELGFRIVRRSK